MFWKDKWAFYRFVENLDREFLPVHINRLMQLLEEIVDLEEYSLRIDVDDNSQVLRIGSQERSGLRRTTSSQGRGLQPELRMMVQTMQQQLGEQKGREDKLLTQLEQQREQEDKLLAQLTS